MNGSTLIIDAFWVSNKPFPTAQNNVSPDGKIFSKYYTDEARYIGWMDLVLLNDIVKKHNIIHIILRNLDTFGKIANETCCARICVAYQYEHFVINKTTLKGKPVQLKHCKPIYDETRIGGWNFSEDAKQLPSGAIDYMRIILKRTRVNCITYATNKALFTLRFDECGNVVFESEPIT